MPRRPAAELRRALAGQRVSDPRGRRPRRGHHLLDLCGGHCYLSCCRRAVICLPLRPTFAAPPKVKVDSAGRHSLTTVTAAGGSGRHRMCVFGRWGGAGGAPPWGWGAAAAAPESGGAPTLRALVRWAFQACSPASGHHRGHCCTDVAGHKPRNAGHKHFNHAVLLTGTTFIVSLARHHEHCKY